MFDISAATTLKCIKRVLLRPIALGFILRQKSGGQIWPIDQKNPINILFFSPGSESHPIDICLQIITMPFVNVWLHFVWATKNRYPYLEPKIRRKVIWHIRENARRQNIFIDCINGYVDHMHCLIRLTSTQSMSQLMHLIKGESSHWINENNLCEPDFDWQDSYYVGSVSSSHLQRVRRYIVNQEKHHCKQHFSEEVKQLLKQKGWRMEKDGPILTRDTKIIHWDCFDKLELPGQHIHTWAFPTCLQLNGYMFQPTHKKQFILSIRNRLIP